MQENSILDNPTSKNDNSTNGWDRTEVLGDFEIGWVSREASLLARKEVLTGKAKFGITGDGKEVPQVALARCFKKGDWRSGYYRDQTFMFALGLCTVEEYFAQLYADPANDPWSGGRQMNSHFASPTIDKDGNWTDHSQHHNIASDISCTAGQMARALGLALASKKYRSVEQLKNTTFSNEGKEVCFVTIGDASTSEGIFWESINAAGVMQVPIAISVWDDGYGISVPVEYQTTKGSISDALQGFQYDSKKKSGIKIFKEKGWDYPALRKMYEQEIPKIRKNHIPTLFHIHELTQPQGHSTSGSQERYKDSERLDWERKHDCLVKMEEWIIESGIATLEETTEIRNRAKRSVKEARDRAWKAYNIPTTKLVAELKEIYNTLPSSAEAEQIERELKRAINPVFTELLQNARKMLYAQLHIGNAQTEQLANWIQKIKSMGDDLYSTHLYSSSEKSRNQYPGDRT